MLVAEPHIIIAEPPVERSLEIYTADGLLITVIEVLSPANKTGEGWHHYHRKQSQMIAAGVNLVEIDLLRGGLHTIAAPSAYLRRVPGTCGHICVSRAHRGGQKEVYYAPLRERLPGFRVPLRPADRDVAVDLQPLVDAIHRTGRYWQVNATPPPEPPLPPEEAEWAAACLAAAGWETPAA